MSGARAAVSLEIVPGDQPLDLDLVPRIARRSKPLIYDSTSEDGIAGRDD